MLCSVLPSDEVSSRCHEIVFADRFSAAQHDEFYVLRQPSSAMLDTAPDMSEHEANTERLIVQSTSMKHSEGGWPKDVDSTEPTDVNRYRKKAEKVCSSFSHRKARIPLEKCVLDIHVYCPGRRVQERCESSRPRDLTLHEAEQHNRYL